MRPAKGRAPTASAHVGLRDDDVTDLELGERTRTFQLTGNKPVALPIKLTQQDFTKPMYLTKVDRTRAKFEHLHVDFVSISKAIECGAACAISRDDDWSQVAQSAKDADLQLGRRS